LVALAQVGENLGRPPNIDLTTPKKLVKCPLSRQNIKIFGLSPPPKLVALVAPMVG